MPFPSPGDLPDPGIELWSPALQADALPSEPPGRRRNQYNSNLFRKLKSHLKMFVDRITNAVFWIRFLSVHCVNHHKDKCKMISTHSRCLTLTEKGTIISNSVWTRSLSETRVS